MHRVNIVYWEEDGTWIGYLQEYPDYWTQGETLDDLQEHLKDLYQDMTPPRLHEQGTSPRILAGRGSSSCE